MNLEDLDRVTLVAGAPSSGKTEFALGMLVAAMRRYGDGNAVMTVSGSRSLMRWAIGRSANCRPCRRRDRSLRCLPSHSVC